MSEKNTLSEAMLELVKTRRGLPADWTEAANALGAARQAAFDEEGFTKGSQAVMSYVSAWRRARNLWKAATGERLMTPGQEPGAGQFMEAAS